MMTVKETSVKLTFGDVQVLTSTDLKDPHIHLAFGPLATTMRPEKALELALALISHVDHAERAKAMLGQVDWVEQHKQQVRATFRAMSLDGVRVESAHGVTG